VGLERRQNILSSRVRPHHVTTGTTHQVSRPRWTLDIVIRLPTCTNARERVTPIRSGSPTNQEEGEVVETTKRVTSISSFAISCFHYVVTNFFTTTP
jgi:hypothetical protein